MINVSFIIPFRQYGPHLLKTVASILAQKTTVSFEVIVVNNSADVAPLIPQTKVYHCLKKGPSAARNMGASNASGQFLAFIDADVELDATWLEKSFEEIKKHPTIGAVQTPVITKLADESQPSFLDKYRFASKMSATEGSFVYITKNSVVLNTAACLVRKDTFKRVNGFDEELQRAEDTHFTLKLLASGYFIGLSMQVKARVSNDKSFWAFTWKFFRQGQGERIITNTLGQPPIVAKPLFKHDSALQLLYFKLTRILYSLGFKSTRKKLSPLAYRKGEFSYNRFIELQVNDKRWKLPDQIRLVHAPTGLVFINLDNLSMATIPMNNFSWNFKLRIPSTSLQNLHQKEFVTEVVENEVAS